MIGDQVLPCLAGAAKGILQDSGGGVGDDTPDPGMGYISLRGIYLIFPSRFLPLSLELSGTGTLKTPWPQPETKGAKLQET